MLILIIGLGSIAEKHAMAIRALKADAGIYALRRKESTSSIPGVINIYSLAELPEKPDFVVIASPTSLHGADILRSLSLECPLFIEKPVLSDLQAVPEITAQLAQHHTMTYVGCNMRFHPCVMFLKNLLRDRRLVINEVNIYCGSYLPAWRKNQDYKKSYSSSPSLGGGIHLDMIHEMDYCLWIFGNPSRVSSSQSSKSSLGIESVDKAHYYMSYDNFDVTINLNYFRRDTKRVIEVVTDDDTIEADLQSGMVKGLFSRKIYFHESVSILDTYVKQMAFFIECINNNKVTMNEFCEGADTLKIALNGKA